MVDAGAMVVYYFTDAFFDISPLTAYGKTEAEVKVIMTPLLTALSKLGIKYTLTYSQSATYQEHVSISRILPTSLPFSNNADCDTSS